MLLLIPYKLLSFYDRCTNKKVTAQLQLLCLSDCSAVLSFVRYDSGVFAGLLVFLKLRPHRVLTSIRICPEVQGWHDHCTFTFTLTCFPQLALQYAVSCSGFQLAYD